MPPIEHVFVLMLENRSFDHLFGFSGLGGIDASTGAHTTIDGLTGTESNLFQGRTYSVVRGADWATSVDPGHEFLHVLDQLCGPGARYVPPYPAPNQSGFVDSYSHTGGAAHPGEIMKCFDTPRQLPVLYALAQEYAVCDHWHASVPGPTWPNRMFVHAASSGGLDHSPSTADIVLWETLDGFSFKSGTLFQALKARNIPFHLYSGDEFPMVAALKGIGLGDVHRIHDLLSDLQKRPFPYKYVFIEPSYNVLHEYRNSSSMHPLADVRDGEKLVKTIYEALRASDAWEKSLFLILWDEHGGFYDHVPPPAAVPPGDTVVGSKFNQYGFKFAQYGVRVPALVISPFIPRGTIDHRLYDHASVPATLESLFDLRPMTARDAHASSPLSLLSLAAPRTADRDALPVLPVPSEPPALVASLTPQPTDAFGVATVPVARAGDSVNGGILPAILQSAMRQDLMMAPTEKGRILARVAGLNTREDAMAYLADVQAKLRKS
jgi:phospholipase C